jgi:uncharacterized protein (UPF0212 family)
MVDKTTCWLVIRPAYQHHTTVIQLAFKGDQRTTSDYNSIRVGNTMCHPACNYDTFTIIRPHQRTNLISKSAYQHHTTVIQLAFKGDQRTTSDYNSIRVGNTMCHPACNYDTFTIIRPHQWPPPMSFHTGTFPT